MIPKMKMICPRAGAICSREIPPFDLKQPSRKTSLHREHITYIVIPVFIFMPSSSLWKSPQGEVIAERNLKTFLQGKGWQADRQKLRNSIFDIKNECPFCLVKGEFFYYYWSQLLFDKHLARLTPILHVFSN